MWKIALGVSGGVVVLLVCIACVWRFCCRKKRSSQQETSKDMVKGPITHTQSIPEVRKTQNAPGTPKSVVSNGRYTKFSESDYSTVVKIGGSNDNTAFVPETPLKTDIAPTISNNFTQPDLSHKNYVVLNVKDSSGLQPSNGHVTIQTNIPLASSTLKSPEKKQRTAPQQNDVAVVFPVEGLNVNSGGLDRSCSVREMVGVYEQNSLKRPVKRHTDVSTRLSSSSIPTTNGLDLVHASSDDNSDAESDSSRQGKFRRKTEQIPDQKLETNSNAPSETDYTQMIEDSFNFDELAASVNKSGGTHSPVYVKHEDPGYVVNHEHIRSTISQDTSNHDSNTVHVIETEPENEFTIEAAVLESEDINKGTHERTTSQVSFDLPASYQDKPYQPMQRSRIWTSLNPEASRPTKSHYSVEFKGSNKTKLIFGMPEEQPQPPPAKTLIVGTPMVPPSPSQSVLGGSVTSTGSYKKAKGPFNSSFTKMLRGSKSKGSSKNRMYSGDHYGSRSSLATGSVTGSVVSMSLTGSQRRMSRESSLRGSQILHGGERIANGSYVSTVSDGGGSIRSVHSHESLLY